MRLLPTSHPPCCSAHCPNPPNKMTFNWNNTQTMLLFRRAAQGDRGAAAVRMGAIELTAHYQYNLSSKWQNDEATFSVCSALFTDASAKKNTKKQNNNNMVTARLHPSRCRANICTRPAVRVEKDGRLDFEHTLTHINTHRHPPSAVCSYAVSHLAVFWELNQ